MVILISSERVPVAIFDKESIPEAMRVSAHVRSTVFDIEYGTNGTNRVLWLATQAKFRMRFS
jgi:hypothetical protein